MLTRVLSNDLPRSRVLAVVLVALLFALAFAPFLFSGVKALDVAAKILVFVVLVASFDLLLGFTGIVSFAHTMFFGIGAYGIAIATTRMGPDWTAVAVGLGASLVLSLLLLPNFEHKTLAAWLVQPSVAVPMILMLISIFWHVRLGLQVLIEDYVHDEGNKLIALTILNFYVLGAGAFGIFTVAKLAFTGAPA